MKNIFSKFSGWRISIITFIFSIVFSGSLILIINETQKINYETPNPNGIQYISERSFSLKISGIYSNESSTRTSTVYGTGWLFAKDTTPNNNNFTYYVATNLHVASSIQNAGKTYYVKNENGVYQQETGIKYNSIQFGQIGEIKNNEFIPGTTSKEINWNDINFYQYIPIYSNNIENNPIKIFYTSFDMFKNKNIQYWSQKEKIENNYNFVYGDESINNGTLDIAILKIDFSSRQWIDSSKQVDTLKYALSNFDKKPTKFAKTNNTKDPITIAGFPVNQQQSLPEWQALENKKFYNKQNGSNAFKMNNWKDGIPENTNNDSIKKNYSLPTNINYVTNEYASYWNVASQYMYDNANLHSGSSGSMAINPNNEVIGIYWGTYQLSDGSIKGVVDTFINSKYENEFLKKYNLINDFSTKSNISL